jgi:hypothetical protein
MNQAQSLRFEHRIVLPAPVFDGFFLHITAKLLEHFVRPGDTMSV